MNYKAPCGLAAMIVVLAVGTASADLILLGPDSLGGQGLGAVETVLTMTSLPRARPSPAALGVGPVARP
jgi:hypothetical protein